MALQVGSWEKFFEDAKIPKKEARSYAKLFSENRISVDILPDLTKDVLRDIGITVMGDILSILRQCKTAPGTENTPVPLQSKHQQQNY